MEARSRLEEPPVTDLEYYARPENYTGSNINTLTRFLIAKEQEEPRARRITKKKKDDSEERKLFRRYRHILPPGYRKSALSSSSDDDDWVESDEAGGISFRDTSQHKQPNSCKNTPTRKKSPTSSNEENKYTKTVSKKDSDVRLKNRIHFNRDSFSNSDSKEENTEDGYYVHSPGQTPPKKLSDSSTDSGTRSSIDDYCQGQDSDDGQVCDKQRSRFSLPNSDSPQMILESRTSLGNLTTPSRKIGVAKMISMKNRLTQLSKIARRRIQSERFRRITVGIINVLKLAKAIIKPTDSPNALLMSFTALATEEKPEEQSENMKNYGLHFDPSYFKANKEISVSSEVKSFLSLPPNRRTSEQIQTAIFGLQSLSSFAEYPLHIQEKLARVAWYEIVTPMRTIIRQGHFAENFYFILSGKALVTLHKPGETGPKTAGMMKKGTSFGELALLHHSRRTATVTSHDTVQLLSIGREDFFDIFMSRHGVDDMPEHIKFVSQLEFMRDWPVERLLERPDQCLLLFFKRNTVIQKDSKSSDWFYIIKSGSCQVLKELKGVTARGPQEKNFDGISFGHHQIQQRNRLRTSYDDDNAQDDDKNDNNKTTPVNKSFAGKSFSKLQYSSGLNTGNPHFTHRKSHANSETQQNETSSVFIHMEILKPKDVFGLDCVSLDSNIENTSSSVILVSLGAECIMLSKAFFMKHVNDRVKKHLSEIVTPYPDEHSMQQSLQDKADWELYKQSLITQMAVEKPTGLRNQPFITQW